MKSLLGNMDETDFICKFSIVPYSCKSRSCALIKHYNIACEGLIEDRIRCPYWNKKEVE